MPKPRAHLTRYHGVFAPASAVRAQIVPGRKAGKVGKAEGGEGQGPAEPTEIERHRSMSWAQRLKRVFAIEIQRCHRCGGKLRVIASIEEAAVIERILDHLGCADESVDPAHQSRALPQGELSLCCFELSARKANTAGYACCTGRVQEDSSACENRRYILDPAHKKSPAGAGFEPRADLAELRVQHVEREGDGAEGELLIEGYVEGNLPAATCPGRTTDRHRSCRSRGTASIRGRSAHVVDGGSSCHRRRMRSQRAEPAEMHLICT